MRAVSSSTFLLVLRILGLRVPLLRGHGHLVLFMRAWHRRESRGVAMALRARSPKLACRFLRASPESWLVRSSISSHRTQGVFSKAYSAFFCLTVSVKCPSGSWQRHTARSTTPEYWRAQWPDPWGSPPPRTRHTDCTQIPTPTRTFSAL